MEKFGEINLNSFEIFSDWSGYDCCIQVVDGSCVVGYAYGVLTSNIDTPAPTLLIDSVPKYRQDLIDHTELEPYQTADKKLYAVFIHPNYRNNGLGSFMLEKLINEVKNKTNKEIINVQIVTSKKSLSFYKRIGFQEVPNTGNQGCGVVVEMII